MFDVILPDEAERITGIGISVFAKQRIPVMHVIPVLIPPATSPQWIGFNASKFFGDLRMQSYGKSNVFYSEDLYLQDSNIGQGYFSTIPGFSPQDWSHRVVFHKTEVHEDCDGSVLKGIYRDRQITGGGIQNYAVLVYVWYELKTKKQ